VAILGGTGFIGSHLVQVLVREGVEVTVVSRHLNIRSKDSAQGLVSYAQWDGSSVQALVPIVEMVDAVVNLVGEGIADKRWTPDRKASILSSRINTANALYLAIVQASTKPEVVVQASAIGYYGYKYERKERIEVDEYSETGVGFLAEVCKQWEEAILPVESIIPRLVVVRSGVVLGNKGGLIKKLTPIFKLGLGGVVGAGYQPFSWIHIEDEVGAIAHLVRDRSARGVYNLVAPNPCTYRSFVKDFGRALHRPVVLAIPTWAIRLLFGAEMANEVFLGGKEVVPRRLLESGYSFKYPLLMDALEKLRMENL